MHWITRFSAFFSAALAMILLSPSLQSFSPAAAIRSSHPYADEFKPQQNSDYSSFRESPMFRNAEQCRSSGEDSGVCNPNLVHVAITLDIDYLRGSIAAVNSILQHSMCPQSVFFHFLVSSESQNLESLIRSTFPKLTNLKIYYFAPETVQSLISSSVRQALEQPLNYARNYLADLLEPCVKRVIYLDSDLVVVDDIVKLWKTGLGQRTIGAPEYCHANFTQYFTSGFWSDPALPGLISGQKPCYFNTGVMVMDLVRWREGNYREKLEQWMQLQKKMRIYDLGSLPPFLLVFAGNVEAIDHRWNQHGLGGDNIRGSCRSLHPGPVSLLHWSGKGKPWVRLDEKRPCPLDHLWEPYDLYEHKIERAKDQSLFGFSSLSELTEDSSFF